MSKTTIFLLLFLLISGAVFSQGFDIQYEIKWGHPREYNLIKQGKEIKSGKYLAFEQAHYLDEGTLLPYFKELIDLSNLSDVEVQLKNTQFENLKRVDLLNEPAKKFISDHIKIHSDVYLSAGQPKLAVDFVPVRRSASSGGYEKLKKFTLAYTIKRSRSKEQFSETSIAEESVLADGKWAKIRVKRNGVYKLTYGKLKKMGFEDLSNIHVYGNAEGVLPISNQNYEDKDPVKNALHYELGGDNSFDKGDYVFFYAKSPDSWTYNKEKGFFHKKPHSYTAYNYYFITNKPVVRKSVENLVQPSQSATRVVDQFLDYKHHEIEDRNVIQSGRLWVGELFDFNSRQTFSFSFPNLVSGSQVKFRTDFVGRSPIESNLSHYFNDELINNTTIPAVDFDYTGKYAEKVHVFDSLLATSPDLAFTLQYNKSSASALGWLDFITVNAIRSLTMKGDQMHFRIGDQASSEVVEVKIENAGNVDYVWEVTDPNNIKNINFDKSNGMVRFKATAGDSWREFVAFDKDAGESPEFVGPVENQNLHSHPVADMLIVTKEKYWKTARRIATLHENEDGMNIHVVTDQQIFNEFSSGCPDPSAIRNYVRMVYERSTNQDSLKYLLLVGDGTYDNRECHTKDNLITYQSQISLNYSDSFVSDDFYGLLDPMDNTQGSLNGLLDIGIGRLPVKNTQEAQVALDKIETYMHGMDEGFWTNKICQIADDEDGNRYMEDAENLSGFIEKHYPSFSIEKIYLDRYQQEVTPSGSVYPQVNKDIREMINNGILIFNYTGHGGEKRLAHEKIFTKEDINSLVNAPKFPLFLTATCEFTRWDAVNYTSAGEKVFLNPQGGGIALFSTTRLVYNSLNYSLNRAFYNIVFEKDAQGKPFKLGDIVRVTKNNAGSSDNKRNFSLIGDPAISLPLGEKNMVMDSLFANSAPTDTLKALDKVLIQGHVEDPSGNIDPDYNGKAFVRVKGKKHEVVTKANDGGEPFHYKIRKNNLFKGVVSVRDGYFTSRFVVPRDLIQDYGSGKMNYLSNNTEVLGQGADTSFTVGGMSDHMINDEQGPGIEMFMNDEDFVSGGITNENPVLYANLMDSSGINISGSGLGHDLTAILDGDHSNKFVLNDYYQANEDSYQKGKVEYQFNDLEKGAHTLQLEAWDVNNNLSTASIEFRVTESASLKLDHVLNYPNPFTESTQFYFEHNRPNEQLDVMIQVFTVSGKLVKTIHKQVLSSGFRAGPIFWDGRDDFGDKIGKGVYIYRLKIRSESGKTAEKTEKLVILK